MRSSGRAHLIWIAIALPWFAAAQNVDPEDVGLSEERLERIGELVGRHVEAGDITGAVTLVARNGRIAHLEAHGIMDIASDKAMTEDAIFRIASMSKPVGAVAILMLIEEGKVRLDDPVSRFIPSYENMQVGIAQPRRAFGGFGGPPPAPGTAPEFYTVPAEHDITILDLLTHTSGLMSGPISNSVAQPFSERRHDQGVAWTESIGSSPLEFQPGTRWSYSAVAGFDVLSRVVEVVSGQTFNDFLRQRVFGPLSMSDTSFWPSEQQRQRLVTTYIERNNELVPRENPDSMSGERYFSAAGGLVTTATDYETGNILNLEGAITKNFGPLGLGVVGYAMIQTTGDSGAGARLGSFESRVYGAGPIVTYMVGDPRNPLTFIAKYYQEFDAENTFEGHTLDVAVTAKF